MKNWIKKELAWLIGGLIGLFLSWTYLILSYALHPFLMCWPKYRRIHKITRAIIKKKGKMETEDFEELFEKMIRGEL